MTLIVRNLELRHSDTNELTNIARSNRQQSVDCTGLQERLRCPCVDGHFGTVRTELDAFFCHAFGTQQNNKLHQFAHFQQTSLQTLTTYNNECFQLSQRDLAFICLLHVAAEMRFAICKPAYSFGSNVVFCRGMRFRFCPCIFSLHFLWENKPHLSCLQF